MIANECRRDGGVGWVGATVRRCGSAAERVGCAVCVESTASDEGNTVGEGGARCDDKNILLGEVSKI